ncbi:MAG: hypothetical protein HUJ59_05150, partial [Bacilli bacterium]|nr:hypothetical protein [Bacilli bacterium]
MKNLKLKKKTSRNRESANNAILFSINGVIFLSLLATVILTNYNYRDSLYKSGVTSLVSDNAVIKESCYNYVDKKATEVKTILEYQKTKNLSYENFLQYLKDTYTNPEYISSQTRFQLLTTDSNGYYKGYEITGKGSATNVDYSSYSEEFVKNVLTANGSALDKTTTLNETLTYSRGFNDPLNSDNYVSCVHAHIRLTNSGNISKTYTLLSVFSTSEVIDLFTYNYYKNADSCLVDTDGNFIIKTNSAFKGYSNILDAIKDYNNLSFAEISDLKFEFGMNGYESTKEYLNADGKKYIFAYSNYAGQKWLSITLIKTTSINTQVPLEALIYFIVVVMLVVVVLDLLLLINSNKKMRAS